MNIAVYTNYKQLLNNGLFDLTNGSTTNSEALERYQALRQYLQSKDVRIETYDVYLPGEKIDLWLFIDPPGDVYRFMIRHRISPRRSILFLVEPPVGNPWFYSRSWFYFRLFGRILSWNSELVASNRKFCKFLLPYRFDAGCYSQYLDTSKQKLCVMMHSNKTSSVSGELYTLRRKIISYFEERGDSLLDLYGAGWNDALSPSPFFTSLHKGWFLDKRACLASYSYSLCIDNMLIPGYLTYDPFISMSVGTVPVYLPMPDADQYIPRDTYVDYNDFDTMDELVKYLVSLRNTAEYEKMRERGWQFLNSPAYRPFTVEKFSEDVYSAILELAEN